MSSSARDPFRPSPGKSSTRYGRHATLPAFIANLRLRLEAAQKTAAAFRKKAEETGNSSLQIYFVNTATTYQVIADSHETALARLLQEQGEPAKSCES